ncbi:MAG TPA: NfeD family protein [Aggregatilineales bacterium]|nr:NfeD family protein [Aggregatilineales bacterium]
MAELADIYRTLGTDVVYVVLIVGFWLTLTSIYVPGTGLLEVAAVIVLIAAGAGLVLMPTSVVGLALLLVALICLVARISFRRNNILYAVGFACHVLGSIFVFQPGSRPSVLIIIAANLLALAFYQLILQPGLLVLNRVSPLDPDVFIGADAIVEGTIDPIGTVRVDGSVWSATADELIESGRRVRVVSRKGLQLYVVPIDEP